MTYTEKQIKEFERACAILNKLAKQGAIFYVTPPTINLMSAPSHDEDFNAHQENVVESIFVSNIDAGDW